MTGAEIAERDLVARIAGHRERLKGGGMVAKLTRQVIRAKVRRAKKDALSAQKVEAMKAKRAALAKKLRAQA